MNYEKTGISKQNQAQASIFLRQPTASYHDSFQGKIAESRSKRGYNADYQGTNI